MSFKEKSVWIMAILSGGAYLAYVSIILGRAENTPLTEVPYVSTLLWIIGVVIAASIVAHIVVAIASPRDAGKEDQRDKEIDRFGEYVGQWVVVAGAVAAFVMSAAELAHFWIANAIYLAFVLSTLVGSATKIVAYRRGFPLW